MLRELKRRRREMWIGLILLSIGGGDAMLWAGEKIRFSNQSGELNLPQSRKKQDLLSAPSQGGLSSGGGGGSPFLMPPGLNRNTQDSSEKNSKSWMDLTPEDLGSFMTPDRAFNRWDNGDSWDQNWLQLGNLESREDRGDDSNGSREQDSQGYSLFGDEEDSVSGDSSRSFLQNGDANDPLHRINSFGGRDNSNAVSSQFSSSNSRTSGMDSLLRGRSTEPVFQSSQDFSEFSFIQRRDTTISDLLNSVSGSMKARQRSYAEQQEMLRQQDFQKLLRPNSVNSAASSAMEDPVNQGEDTTQNASNPFRPQGLAEGDSRQRPDFMNRLSEFEGNRNALRAGPSSLDSILGNARNSRSPSTTPSSAFSTRPTTATGYKARPPVLSIPGRKF